MSYGDFKKTIARFSIIPFSVVAIIFYFVTREAAIQSIGTPDSEDIKAIFIDYYYIYVSVIAAYTILAVTVLYKKTYYQKVNRIFQLLVIACIFTGAMASIGRRRF